VNLNEKSSVAVVGNAGILLEERCGKDIDSFDKVIRFGNYKILDKEITGTKETIWCTTFCNDILPRKTEYEAILCPLPLNVDKYLKIYYATGVKFLNSKMEQIEFIPLEIFEDIVDKIKNPSSGICLLYWLKTLGVNLTNSVFGFSFFAKDSPHHYWGKGKAGHSWHRSNEKGFFNKYISYDHGRDKNKMKYAIGTGYTGSEELFRLWLNNTNDAHPSHIFVCAAGDYPCPKGDIVYTEGPNWGHVFDMQHDGRFGGWSMGFMHGMMQAYARGCDYIYKEEDCFAFGDWVKNIYAVNKNMVFGEYDHPLKVEQSLVLVKWDFIPDFLSAFLGIRESDKIIWPEKKFSMMLEKFPDEIGFIPFGYGRNRPIDFSQKTWYAQKLSAFEMKIIDPFF
jgi:hypothetical protein